MSIFSILKLTLLREKHAPLSTVLLYLTVSKVSKLTDFNSGIKAFLLSFGFTLNCLLYFFIYSFKVLVDHILNCVASLLLTL